jgi:hypothetical protein
VERPFRYVREDFFLARSFRNLDDLNGRGSESALFGLHRRAESAGL